MRRNKKNLDQLLDHHLGLFKASLRKQPDAARESVLNRLQSEAGAAAAFEEESPKNQRRLRRQYLIAAAAAVLALAALFVGRFKNGPIAAKAVVETADGSVYRLAAGEIFRTNSADGAVLSLADGSRVEMRAASELSLERVEDGVRIRLSKGGVIVNAAKQRTGHLYVQTRDVTVSVVGTVFLVNAEEKGSRVAVIEGEVRVQQGATSKKLLSGEQVATNPSMESQPVSEEISWSRNAEAHLALLQQSAVVPITAPAPALPVPPEAQDVFEVASVRSARIDGGGGARGGGMSIMPSGCGGNYPIQIDPRRFAVYGTTLHVLVAWAYGTGKIDYDACRNISALNLISGGPAWVRSDLWDIQAVIPEGALNDTQEQSRKGDAPKFRKMLQALLADRFKLVMRSETKEVQAYALTAEKGAPRSSLRAEIDTPEFREMRAKQSPGIIAERGAFLVTESPIADFIPLLERETSRPVLDRTGLTGRYSFVVEYTPLYRIQNGGTLLGGPAIFSALPEQVGLKLEPVKTTLEVWVIERAEKPSEN